MADQPSDHSASTPPTPPADSTTPPKKRRKGRVILFSLLGLIVLLLVLVALTPAILSTGWGRGIVQNVASDSVPGSIAIDDLSLSWFGGQTLNGVVLKGVDGEAIAEVGSLSTQLSLWNAIMGDLNLGETVITDVDATVVIDEEGVSNLERALGLDQPKPEEPDQPAQIPPSLRLHGKLVNANVSVTQPGQPTVVFRDVNGEVKLAGPTQPIALALTGTTQQGDLSGSIAIDGTASNVFDAEGVLTPGTIVADVKANVTNLPVAGVDALAGQEGLLVAALGDLLNVQVTANATQAQQTFAANIASPNLKADIAGRVAENQFALTQPAVVEFLLTPPLVAQFAATGEAGAPGEQPMSLAQPVPLTLRITQVSAPVTDSLAGPITIHAELSAGGDIQLRDVQQVGQVTIANLTGKLDAERLTQQVQFALNAGLIAGGQPGKLAINGSAANVLTDKPLALNATAALEGLPTALVDRIAQQEGKLIALLGEQINLRATANTQVAPTAEPAAAAATTPPAGDLSLALTTPLLNTGDIAFAIADGRVQLRSSAEIQYQLTPQAAQQLLGPEPAATVDQPATLTLRLDELSAPWPQGDQPAFQPARTQLKASLTSTPLHMGGLPQVEQIVLERLQATIATPQADQGLGNIQLALSSTLSDPRQQGLLRTAAGSPLVMQLNAATGLVVSSAAAENADAATPGALKPITAVVKLQSDAISADLAARIDSEFETLALTKPGTLRMRVTPQLLQQLELTSPDQPGLGQPTTVNASIASLQMPLAGFAIEKVKAELAAQFDQLVVAGDDPRLAGAAIRNGKIALNLDGPAGVVIANIDAQAAVPGQNEPGPIAINARVSDLFKADTQPAVEAKAQVQGLPTAFVDMVANQGGTLPPLLGPAMNVNAVASLRGGNGTVAAELASANLKASADLAMRDNLLTANKPVQATLTLTPAGYAALTRPAPPSPAPEAGQSPNAPPTPPTPGTSGTPGAPAEPPPLVLAENATLQIDVPQLAWPQPPEGQPFDPSRAAIKATVTSPSLTMRDRNTGQTVTLRDLNMTLDGPNLAQPVNAAIRSQVLTTVAAAAPASGPGRSPQVPEGVIGRPAPRSAAPLPPRDNQPASGAAGGVAAGSLAADLRIADLYTREGQFNADGMTVLANAKLADFPTAVADQMLAQEGLLVAALGPNMQLNVKADLQQMKGPVVLNLIATHATADIDALYQGDVLTLRQPLTTNLRVTPELGTRFLSKLNFIFESLEGGEDPVQVRIEPKGFVLPIENFDLARVQVPRLTIAPGELVLNNRGYVGGLLNLWKKVGGGLGDRSTDRVNAVFTPLVAHIENGRFVYDARMDLRIAGALHVATWGTVDLNNNIQDLTLAIMPETLDKIFDLEDVQPDEALRIQMTGDPVKDLTGSTLSILTTAARGGAFGGDKRIGQIIGAVGGALSGRKELKGPLPPPSMQPLPWAPLEDLPGAPLPPGDGRQPPRMQPDGAPGTPVAPPPPGTRGTPDAPPPPPDGDQPPRKQRRPNDREMLEKAAGSLLEGLLKPKQEEKK